jgi:hypothetical protein
MLMEKCKGKADRGKVPCFTEMCYLQEKHRATQAYSAVEEQMRSASLKVQEIEEVHEICICSSKRSLRRLHVVQTKSCADPVT